MATIFVALAYPAAHFFDGPRLENIVYVLLSLGMLFKGFSNIGMVNFRKNLLFHKEFLWLISNKLIAFAVTIMFIFTPPLKGTAIAHVLRASRSIDAAYESLWLALMAMDAYFALILEQVVVENRGRQQQSPSGRGK